MNRDFKLFFSVFALTFAIIVGAFTATQGAIAESVHPIEIDSIVLSRCGQQFVYASGTAVFGPFADHLLVDIDGTHVFNLGKQESWVTGLAELTPGQHTITARIHNTDASYIDTSKTFEVPSCDPEPTPEPKKDSGPGDEKDCCPGPDPDPVAPKKPQVKGTSTVATKTSNDPLTPLNSFFRSVWHRTPTYFEWKYWAERFLNDKPAYDQLLGAMQWQESHGLVTGS